MKENDYRYFSELIYISTTYHRLLLINPDSARPLSSSKNKHPCQASNENRQTEANRTTRDRIKDFTHPSTILSWTQTQSERIAAHSPAAASSNRITIGTSSIENSHRRGRTDLCSTYSSRWSFSFVPVMPRCLFQISK